eukprot:Pgem_evm1s19804
MCRVPTYNNYNDNEVALQQATLNQRNVDEIYNIHNISGLIINHNNGFNNYGDYKFNIEDVKLNMIPEINVDFNNYGSLSPVDSKQNSPTNQFTPPAQFNDMVLFNNIKQQQQQQDQEDMELQQRHNFELMQQKQSQLEQIQNFQQQQDMLDSSNDFIDNIFDNNNNNNNAPSPISYTGLPMVESPIAYSNTEIKCENHISNTPPTPPVQANSPPATILEPLNLSIITPVNSPKTTVPKTKTTIVIGANGKPKRKRVKRKACELSPEELACVRLSNRESARKSRDRKRRKEQELESGQCKLQSIIEEQEKRIAELMKENEQLKEQQKATSGCGEEVENGKIEGTKIKRTYSESNLENYTENEHDSEILGSISNVNLKPMSSAKRPVAWAPFMD